ATAGFGIAVDAINRNYAKQAFEKQQQLSVDLFNLNNKKIQATPPTVRQVSSGNGDNWYKLIVQQYTSFEEEIANYEATSEYLGYTLNKVTTLTDDILKKPITSTMIKTSISNQNVVDAINQELEARIKIIQ
ncbi:MAG: hypothetical protein LBH47_02725, partial [Christensenellaceae bacterium]|nr:hypothetical protein [Christensenellaceae bacterium]